MSQMERSEWDPDWDLIQEIYQAALNKPFPECAQFVADACQYDSDLVREILSLLAAHHNYAVLEKLIAERMDLKCVAPILKELGDVLDGAHQKGSHGDLNPKNILVQQGTESFKVLDLGIATVRDSTVRPVAVKKARGAIAYLSPERLRGERSTPRSDVYSLAVVAYEMITGKRPFNAHSAEDLLAMQRGGLQERPIELRPELSPKAQSILLRALSFEQKARYRSAKEFGDKLARALLDKRRPSGLDKWFAVIGTLLMAFTLVSFGFYWYRKGPSDPSPSHSFEYWLILQKTRDGQDYQEPNKTFGDETFENGDKFQLNVSGNESGYFYIFNVGPPEPNVFSFKMIYPNQVTNNGSASVGANQPVQSKWITFRGPPGSENFWIVWSASPINELEVIKIEAFKHPEGGLADQTVSSVKEFLSTKKSEIKIRRSKANQSATVRGTGDVLISFVEFAHR